MLCPVLRSDTDPTWIDGRWRGIRQHRFLTGQQSAAAAPSARRWVAARWLLILCCVDRQGFIVNELRWRLRRQHFLTVEGKNIVDTLRLRDSLESACSPLAGSKKTCIGPSWSAPGLPKSSLSLHYPSSSQRTARCCHTQIHSCRRRALHRDSDLTPPDPQQIGRCFCQGVVHMGATWMVQQGRAEVGVVGTKVGVQLLVTLVTTPLWDTTSTQTPH